MTVHCRKEEGTYRGGADNDNCGFGAFAFRAALNQGTRPEQELRSRTNTSTSAGVVLINSHTADTVVSLKSASREVIMVINGTQSSDADLRANPGSHSGGIVVRWDPYHLLFLSCAHPCPTRILPNAQWTLLLTSIHLHNAAFPVLMFLQKKTPKCPRRSLRERRQEDTPNQQGRRKKREGMLRQSLISQFSKRRSGGGNKTSSSWSR